MTKQALIGAIEAVAAALADRTAAKLEQRCVQQPIGCGQPLTGFRNDAARKEYDISALCQACQDRFYEQES